MEITLVFYPATRATRRAIEASASGSMHSPDERFPRTSPLSFSTIRLYLTLPLRRVSRNAPFQRMIRNGNSLPKHPRKVNRFF